MSIDHRSDIPLPSTQETVQDRQHWPYTLIVLGVMRARAGTEWHSTQRSSTEASSA